MVGTYGTASTEPNTVAEVNMTVVSPELIDQSEDENLMERSSSNVQGNLMHTLGKLLIRTFFPNWWMRRCNFAQVTLPIPELRPVREMNTCFAQ